MTTITFQELSRKIDDEARHAVVELLEAMRDHLRFELGTDLHVANDGVTVLVRRVRTDPQRYYYAGVVLAGVPAGREVIDIPWSLTDSRGREIGRGVTGAGGHFGFSAAKKLAESSDSVILSFGQTAPPASRQAPEAARQSPILDLAGALAAFRDANAGREDDLRPVVTPAVRWFERDGADPWRCAPVANGHLSAHTGEAEPLPECYRGVAADSGDVSVQERREVDVSIQGDRIRVWAPAELVPYGVVRIVAYDTDALVGTCLLPLIRYQTVRSNLWPLARIVGDRDVRSLTWHAQRVTEETLPLFPADEVAELLDLPDVRDREELRGQVEQLLALARQREASEK